MKEKSKQGLSTAGLEILENKGPLKGLSKHQRSSGGAVLRAGRLRGSSKLGNQAMQQPLRRAFG
jgi:hypothetical protein